MGEDPIGGEASQALRRLSDRKKSTCYSSALPRPVMACSGYGIHHLRAWPNRRRQPRTTYRMGNVSLRRCRSVHRPSERCTHSRQRRGWKLLGTCTRPLAVGEVCQTRARRGGRGRQRRSGRGFLTGLRDIERPHRDDDIPLDSPQLSRRRANAGLYQGCRTARLRPAIGTANFDHSSSDDSS